MASYLQSLLGGAQSPPPAQPPVPVAPVAVPVPVAPVAAPAALPAPLQQPAAPDAAPVCYTCGDGFNGAKTAIIYPCGDPRHPLHPTCGDGWTEQQKAAGKAMFRCGLCRVEAPFPVLPTAPEVDDERYGVYQQLMRTIGRFEKLVQEQLDSGCDGTPFELKVARGELKNFGQDLKGVREELNKERKKLCEKLLRPVPHKLTLIKKSLKYLAQLQCTERKLTFDPDVA